MPPPLPDRYQLEVRVGRDADIEEWLATDTSLDRPVLVRVLGPDASEERRRAFLESVRAAAAVTHPHLASVYNAGEVEDGVYAVAEWTGGMTVADRLASDDTVELWDFLPNAAGLADALAALHGEGVVHGGIDARALFYAVAHPAKLGAFGRPRRDRTASEDVRSLAIALEEALTGTSAGGPPPSEMVDGLSPAVDRALRDAQAGLATARELADALRAAPSPLPPPEEPPGWSRRLLLVAVALVVAAVGLVGLGRLFLVEDDSPVILPEPSPSEPPQLGTTTTTTTSIPDPTATTPTAGAPEVVEVVSVDPFGGGGEHDDELPNLTDGDPATAWTTETYLDPLPLLKPGVGVGFELRGSPRWARLEGVSPGVGYTLAWSEDRPDPESWDRVATGRTTGPALDLRLPRRENGWWVLWLTDLPQQSPEDHSARVGEVRFRP